MDLTRSGCSRITQAVLDSRLLLLPVPVLLLLSKTRTLNTKISKGKEGTGGGGHLEKTDSRKKQYDVLRAKSIPGSRQMAEDSSLDLGHPVGSTQDETSFDVFVCAHW